MNFPWDSFIFGIPVFIVILLLFAIGFMVVYLQDMDDLVEQYKSKEVEENLQQLENLSIRKSEMDYALQMFHHDRETPLTKEEQRIFAMYLYGQNTKERIDCLKEQRNDTKTEIRCLKKALRSQGVKRSAIYKACQQEVHV